jgi:single-strand DNA-binding protein
MYNRITLIGNVGQDPQSKTLDNGTKTTSFTLATSETWKDKQGNKQEETQWHTVKLWRGLAEVAEQYVKKGTKLMIEGKVIYRSYEKDGETKYFTEIVAKEMKMLGGKPSNDEPF